MKAFKVKGIIYGKEYLEFSVATSEEELRDTQADYWHHANIRNLTVEEVSIEQLVDVIDELM